MKVQNNICEGSLITNYLPADYCDSFSKTIVSDKVVTPEVFMDIAFSQSPAWVNGLMTLRNAIVKPLGLEVNIRFTDTILERSPDEIVFGMPDKHLTFYASLWCGEKEVDGQMFAITTIVKYNNRLGRFYFFFIRPFHKTIMRSILNRVAKQMK